jgi:chemotaxis signal transduction protein
MFSDAVLEHSPSHYCAFLYDRHDYFFISPKPMLSIAETSKKPLKGRRNVAPIEEEYPLVLYLIKGVPYATTSQDVRTMTEVPEIIPVPHSPSFVRGLINLRGEVLPLVDLRKRLGLASVLEEAAELNSMFQAREQDHRNWLSELEASVRERRPFALTTDPHQCAFGKWYDKYQTEDMTANRILRQFDQPHKEIHGIAEKIGRLVADEDFDGALKIINATRDNELSQMIQLFSDISAHNSDQEHEIVLVLETSDFNFAITVDSVEAVEFLAEETIQDLPLGHAAERRQPLASKLGRRAKDGTVVQIVEVEQICNREDVEHLASEECATP